MLLCKIIWTLKKMDFTQTSDLSENYIHVEAPDHRYLLSALSAAIGLR